MPFLKDVSHGLSQTAKMAAKKSSNAVEIAKLSRSIGTEEDKIKKNFFEIGKTVYECFKAKEEVPLAVMGLCDAVKNAEENIQAMKLKILELKNLKLCPGCGEKLEISIAYCPKCGTKQHVPSENT